MAVYNMLLAIIKRLYNGNSDAAGATDEEAAPPGPKIRLDVGLSESRTWGGDELSGA